MSALSIKFSNPDQLTYFINDIRTRGYTVIGYHYKLDQTGRIIFGQSQNGKWGFGIGHTPFETVGTNILFPRFFLDLQPNGESLFREFQESAQKYGGRCMRDGAAADLFVRLSYTTRG
jgi:hypothetical protein